MTYNYNSIFIFLLSFYLSGIAGASGQLPSCTGPDSNAIYITPCYCGYTGHPTPTGRYLHRDSIYAYHPSMPVVRGINPAAVRIRPFQTSRSANGLTVGANLNAGGPSPTFYTIMQDPQSADFVYYYYDGSNWKSTGHRPYIIPNLNLPYNVPFGSNIAAGGKYIFNLAQDTAVVAGGFRYAVYRYDGHGDAIRLMTLPDIYSSFDNLVTDIEADCEGNFYLLDIDTPVRWMRKYDPDGLLIRTWSVTGQAFSSVNAHQGNGAFAIINNDLYFDANDAVWHGRIGCDEVVITGMIPDSNPFIGWANDYGTCAGTICDPDPRAIIALSYNDSFCKLQPVLFRNESRNADHYHWDFGDGHADTASSLLHLYRDTGSYLVRLVAYDAAGCRTDTARYLIRIVAPPLPVFQGEKTRLVCAHGEVVLHARVAGDHKNRSFQWGPAHAVVKDGDKQSARVNTLLSNIFYVKVTDSIPGACAASAMDTVYIDLFDFSPMKAYRDTAICPGDTVLLYAVGGDDYRWTPAALQEASEPFLYAAPGTSTRYAVTIRDAETGCQITREVQVLVHPVAADAGPDRKIRKHETVLLTAKGGVRYQWNGQAGAAGDGSLSVAPERRTTYYVTVTTAEGCKAVDSVTVDVSGDPFIPNAFSPNGDGKNDVFKLWAEDALLIDLQVFNRWGQLVYSGQDGWDGTYAGGDCEIGTYYYRCSYRVYDKQYQITGDVLLIR